MTDIPDRSGGVDFDAQQVDVGGDAVGRDKSIVETGGGAYAGGNVQVSGGKFVGRDDRSTTNVYEAPTPLAYALHQLPAPPADFTGRTAELGAILSDLRHGAVITGIRGLGGIGKTALALVMAGRVKAQYPDAQFFVNLQGASDKPLPPRDALAHVVRGFHPVEKLPDDEAGLRAQYLTDLHDKRAIILLDDARDAEQVKPLLPPASCLLFITSRQHFALPGLHATDLDTLPPDDARKLLLEIAPGLTSISLSAEGAKNLLANHPEILRRLTTAQNDTVQGVDVIANLCGCLPLALRVAGSFLAERVDFDVAVYVRRLSENRLKQLSAVNSALQVSYDLLTPELQSLWRQLAVFPSDFDRAAAQAVWSFNSAADAQDAAQDTLSELVRYSLVEYKSRYHLHDLARLFADTRLAEREGERYAAQRRHAWHYSQVLGNAQQMLDAGGSAFMNGLALFDAERPNIQQGQKWSEEHAEQDKEAAETCNSYGWQGELLYLRLHPREQIQWITAALDAAQKLKNRKAESTHLGNLGSAYAALGETRRAIEYHEKSLKIKREIGNRRGEGNSLGNLGTAYAALGETRKAIDLYEQALVINREIGDRRGEGNSLGNLGNAYADLGETRRAIEVYEQALVIDREIGDRRGEGNRLGNLGLAYAAIRETRKAIELYEQHRDIARNIGDQRGEADALMNIGNAHYRLADYQKAIEHHEQALAVFREIGDRRSEGNALGSLGIASYSLGEIRQAIEFYEQYRDIAREIGDRRGEGTALWNMALALDKSGEREQAIAHAEAALKIYEQIEDPHAEMVRRQLAKWKVQ